MGLRLALVLLSLLRSFSGQIMGCPEGQWQCDDGHCIVATWRCDGQGDCLDGSDEMDCAGSQGSECPPGQFPCLDSVGCVEASARCDGQNQCPTGSDEENCPAIEGCLDSEWGCRNGICIPKGLRCNGKNDCVDNSDEDSCGMCAKDGARCLDGTCISAAEWCDGRFQCPDGSDEPITCGSICSVNNGGCSHLCAEEPWGARCVCPAGFKLAANGAVCEDVDECTSPFPPCVHHCTNTFGSYVCNCREGFELNRGSACLASGNATRLLLVQRKALVLLNVKSKQFEMKDLALEPVALAFDISRGLYYWADGKGRIYKSDGLKSWTTFTGEPGIKGLACDWLNGYLFWTNRQTEAIYMLSVDGESYTTLLNKNVRPSDIVVLPLESLMFWINDGPGDRVTLETSWMDGSDRSSLTVLTAQLPHSLTADVAARRLYWISDSKRSIESVKVDGTGRHSVMGVFNRRPAMSLGVFESTFYWVDDKGLWQAPQSRLSQRKFLWKTEQPFLEVYHELQQPKASSPCSKTPCVLCQLTKSNPVGFTCACPYFKVLLPDGSCEYPRFLYGTMTTINLLEFRGDESTETELYTMDDGVLSFDFDWLRDWLYWANQTGHIQRTSLTVDRMELIQTPLPACLINVDQRSGDLYWVSCDQHVIGTTKGGRNRPQQLYRTTKEISSLYLDWLRGGMFWVEEDHIFSMPLPGGEAKELLQMTRGTGGNIAFDLRASSLLWNSRRAGLTALSLLKDRSHHAGRRWNISGSVIAAFEPFLLSITDDVMTLWDLRTGNKIQSVTVRGPVLSIITALGNIQTEPDMPVCTAPSFLCRQSSVCLSQNLLCDGNQDCPEGDDEESCIDTCPPEDDFKCNDGRSCISRSLVCDGRSHCRDGSDEFGCPTLSPVGTQANLLKCRSGSKLCSDGTECVLYSHVCDGEVDCKDGSDELGCEGEVSPEPDEAGPAAEAPQSCQSPSVLCLFSSERICVSPSQFCDDYMDCPDGFDEKDCIKSCLSKNDFLCKNHRQCVPKSSVCDGRSHCADGSDEVNCPSPVSNTPQKSPKCRFGSRLCRDRTACVLLSHVCDGERDCDDGSDEEECESTGASPPVELTTPLCTSPSIQCPSSTLCIKPAQMCDGKRDCPDGSDEKCIKRCSSETDFRCKDRRSCVSKSQVCDGRAQCSDGSDEANCPSLALPSTSKKALKCRFGSKLCSDGTECILLSHFCDGEDDCADGSDEGCDDSEGAASTEPPAVPTILPCLSPSVLCPGSSLCIEPTQMCDGKRDCPDGSDEKCIKRCPSATDFRCKDRRSCVSKNQVCDGRAQCSDGSDEANCPSLALPSTSKKALKCRFGSKLCSDGTECILLSHFCDGEKDCADGSDEEGCDDAEGAASEPVDNKPVNKYAASTTPPDVPTIPPCTSPSVLCPGSSLCIKPTQMCDGKRDCPDGSDEKCIKRCPSATDFRCKDRRSCVSKSQVCDGRAQCSDGSDEANCPSLALPSTSKKALKCRFGSKLCSDGTECILLSHFCDGEKDCADGSDEEGCDDAEGAASEPVDNKYAASTTPPDVPTIPPCTSPSVLCPGSSLCIEPTQMCDGKRDCPDGSDEKCIKRCPSATDFRCKDRRSCVSKNQVCDGRAQCSDGSDEANCPSLALPSTSKKALKCRFGSKLCSDGTECILLSHFCDGEDDCADGSDEENCDVAQIHPGVSVNNYMNDSPSSLKPFSQTFTVPPCTSPSILCPGSSLCIKPTQMCDGKRDCPDGFDEKCIKRCPSQTDFRCKDRRSCVSKSQVCDGRAQCNDGSDEANCPSSASSSTSNKALTCRMGSKLCRDGTECVLFSHVCDGERDCRDGSDEDDCDASEMSTETPAVLKPSCSFPLVLCPGSSICIHPSQLCNGISDCPDRSDENCVKKCADRTDFLCKDRRSCVSRSLVCDGRSHCYDGSDEVNCRSVTAPPPQSNVLKCRMGTRPCKDGRECVLLSHVCDGEIDCLDGSDEEGCQESCRRGEFQCAHGKMCIPEAEVCDGKPQCRDQSDELDCWKRTKSCEHRCSDGNRCIPKKFLCDGERDCLDGSDEMGCSSVGAPEFPAPTSTSACITPSVLCPDSSQCISPYQLCDGQRDCPDGFDENNCVVQCENPEDFLCSDKRKCIPKSNVCDGRAHCPDGSDEKRCEAHHETTSSLNAPKKVPSPLKCLTGFKPCKNGLECVMYSHVCDGEQDCKDGSDEEGCERRCKAGQFQCFHGRKCIAQEQVCDGQNDCQDRSDETNCLSPSEGCQHRCDDDSRCVPQTFLCDGEEDCADGSDEENCGVVGCATEQFRCASGQCVSEALRCDGYPDCRDHSDEAGCTKPPRCASQLRCPHSHECLQKEWLCDGEEDCKDGSDEKNCNVPPVKCRKYQYQCGDSGQCIPLSWRCDGKKDCVNGMDEDKCTQRKCPYHLYQCNSMECLEPRLVCNGITNCADGSDEGLGCKVRNCTSASAPLCDHSCISTPNGPRCYCGAGFRLQSSSKSCMDVDECNSPSGTSCKHICQNNRGSFRCLCHSGYYLEPDGKSCKTKDEPLLLASVQSEMLILGVHSGTLTLLSLATRPVFTLDYHWAQQRVYWLSPDYQSIRWADMKTSNKGTLIKGVRPDSIAVDWVGNNLYWVDGLVGQILALKLSSSIVRSQDYTVVLGDNLEQPSSLILLPHKRLMVWSEIGSTPQIERAGMDGSQRKVVVSQDLSWPVSLAYDFLDDKVYWADEKLRCLGSASLEGENIKIIQLAETPSPFSVAIFNDRVFWSDTKRRTVRSADKKTGKDQKVLLKRPGQPFGLKLMHPFSQPSVPSPCEKMRCTHLCLLAPESTGKSAVCRCPKGLLLSQDGITCSLPRESSFILLLSLNKIYQIYLRSMQRDGVALKKMPNGRDFPLSAQKEPSLLDLSLPELSAYVSYSKHGSVDVLKFSSSRSKPESILVGEILNLQADAVTALAVDWVTSNLYWSGMERPDIYVTSRNDRYTASLQQGPLMAIASIALHPSSGVLCFSAVVMIGVKSQTEVDCAWMDGRNKVVLWRKSSIPISLVFSNDGKRIYWADTGEGVLSSIGVDGSEYRAYKTGPNLLMSFTRIENIFLWVTQEKGVSKLWYSDGLQPKQLWFETKTRVLEVRAYNNDTQAGSNSCTKNNGGCIHLCLPHPGGRTCVCGRGFFSVNETTCSPLPSCPDGEESCFDGRKCISSKKFCDGRVDCLDESDEQNCSSSDSSGTRGGSRRSQQPSSLLPGSQKDSVLPREDLAPCDLKRCSGHGSCITEDDGTHCQCLPGYEGEFCHQQSGSKSHPAIILLAFCLVSAVVVAAFVFTKRKGWEYFRSSSADKETLMAHMVLPAEQDSDSEELDSPVDGNDPLQALKSRHGQ